MKDNSSKWWDDFWTEEYVQDCSTDQNLSWYDLIWQENYRNWHSIFSQKTSGKKMLECGCGSAKISKFMAGRNYECTLLDCSEKALLCAKQNFLASGLNAEFVLGDINNLDFPDNSFDIIYSGGVLEFFHDVRRPMNEMIRVLKPGGIFAANMVPRKFSIQSIADLERTFIYSVRNMFKRDFKKAFQRVHMVPKEFNVNSLSIADYISLSEDIGLFSVVGRVISPFPNLALPDFGKKIYAKIMKRLIPEWRKFNDSNAAWTKAWGIVYSLYGIKGGMAKNENRY